MVGRVVDAGKPRTLTVEGRRRGCGAGLRGEVGDSIPGGVLSGDGDEAEISAGRAGRQDAVNRDPMPRPRCCLADRDTVNRDPMPRSRCRCYLGHIRPRTDSRQLSTAFLPPKRRHSGVRLLRNPA